MNIVVLLVVLFSAALTDFYYEKVPNPLILGGIILGVGYRFLMGTFAPAEMLCGIVAPILLFWPLFLVRAMGAGDIKLMSVIGLFLGWKSMLQIVAYAIVIAALAGLYKSLRQGSLKGRFIYLVCYLKQFFLCCRAGSADLPVYRSGKEDCSTKVHFAIALLAGGLVVTGGFL